MRSKLFISSLCFLFVGTSYASEMCGTIKRFSRYKKEMCPSGHCGTLTAYRLEFDNGLKLDDVKITVGDQALLAGSMTNKLIVCFNEEESNVYSFSSASK